MKPITAPESSILDELDELKPNGPVANLSRNQRYLIIERAFIALYRWYIARSQETRNWNPDLSFEWQKFGQGHSDEVHHVIEGFYAVEQYVPDYVTALLKVIRRSYGRSHFHLRWGAEEERHADMWRNAVLFGGKRSLKWVEEYGDILRGQEWKLPWEDPVHMIYYTVFQERATQVNYMNLGIVAKGESQIEGLKGDADPVLLKCCSTIATDEAAHYNFFLQGALLFLYYFPEEAIQAIVDVLRHFAMPAGDLIPDYDRLADVLHRSNIYGPRQHMRDVVKVALEQLGAESLKAVEAGIRRSREVPLHDGTLRRTAMFETLDFNFVESKVKLLYGRVQKFESSVGLDKVAPTHFYPNPELFEFNSIRQEENT